MKKLKVLLTAAVLRIEYEELGICYIASVLRQNGFTVKVMTTERENDAYYREILDFKPDLLGVSVYNITKELCYSICRKVRAELPELKICLGGIAPTCYGSEMLQEASFVDFIIKGEGEITLLELMERLEINRGFEGIRGLCYRDGGTIYENPARELIENLNQLPFPGRDILEQHHLSLAMLSTSRGCTRNCSFCVTPQLWKTGDGKRWRGWDAIKVVDEIEYLIRNYHCNTFIFNDSSFEDPTLERPAGIAREIIGRGLKVYYSTYFRADFYKKTTPELMELFKESGLSSVFIGVEAGNEHDLKLYNKGVTVQDNYNCVKFFQTQGYNVSIGFINFNPYSSFETLRQNMYFLQSIGYTAFVYYRTLYDVYRGTKLYEKAEKDCLLTEMKLDYGNDYRFKDERIGRMAHFINRYFIPIEEEFGDLHHYYAVKLPDILLLLKKRFHTELSAELLTILAEGEEYIRKTLINLYNCNWFVDLLDLAEKNWSEDQAGAILDRVFDRENINQVFTALQNNRNKLFRRLIRANPDFVKYLTYLNA